MDALRMAQFRRQPGKEANVIFHSDRGSQYCSGDFQDGAYELRHAQLDGAARATVGTMLRRISCGGSAEGRPPVRAQVRDHAGRQGRDHRLDGVLQPSAPSLNAGLRHVRCNSNGLGSLPRKSEPRNAAGQGMRFPGARSIVVRVAGELLRIASSSQNFSFFVPLIKGIGNVPHQIGVTQDERLESSVRNMKRGLWIWRRCNWDRRTRRRARCGPRLGAADGGACTGIPPGDWPPVGGGATALTDECGCVPPSHGGRRSPHPSTEMSRALKARQAGQ